MLKLLSNIFYCIVFHGVPAAGQDADINSCIFMYVWRGMHILGLKCINSLENPFTFYEFDINLMGI